MRSCCTEWDPLFSWCVWYLVLTKELPWFEIEGCDAQGSWFCFCSLSRATHPPPSFKSKKASPLDCASNRRKSPGKPTAQEATCCQNSAGRGGNFGPFDIMVCPLMGGCGASLPLIACFRSGFLCHCPRRIKSASCSRAAGAKSVSGEVDLNELKPSMNANGHPAGSAKH